MLYYNYYEEGTSFVSGEVNTKILHFSVSFLVDSGAKMGYTEDVKKCWKKVHFMTNRFIGILLIIAGLVTPVHKESLSSADWTVMLLFLISGGLVLLFSFLNKTEKDDVYRINLQFEELHLFDEDGLPALKIGQQLYVQPYAGALKEDIHILTAEGQLVAKLPQEHREHVLHKLENHSPVHLLVKHLQLNQDSSTYSAKVEMMC